MDLSVDRRIPTALVAQNALVRECFAHVMADYDLPVSRSVSLLSDLDFIDPLENHILVYDRTRSFSLDDVCEIETTLLEYAHLRIVLVVDAYDVDLIRPMFAAGIYSFVLYGSPVEGFVSMMRLVALGCKVVPSDLIDNVRQSMFAHTSRTPSDIAQVYGLGSREHEVLKCLMAGMPNKSISRSVGVSEATIKLTVKSVFRKMSVTNRTQAAILGHEGNGAVHAGHSAESSRDHYPT